MKYNLPTGFLSPTQINMFLKCGQQYCFRYPEGKKYPPGIALVEGGTYHVALDMNNTHKIVQHEDLKPKTMLRRFACTFDDRKKIIGDWQDQTIDNVIKRGKVLLPMYLKRFAPFYQPNTSEKKLTIQLGDIKLLCILDTTGKLHLPFMANPRESVVDYKAVGRKQSQATLNSDIQLSAQALVATRELNIKNPEVGFCDLLKTKVPSVQWLKSPMTAARLKWFEQLVHNVAAMISKGAFPLTKPDNWWCNPKWCGYWSICRGKTQRRKK